MKHAIVTGSSGGIGCAIAYKLEENGYCVFRNGRKERPNEAKYIQADVSTREGVQTLVDALLAQTQTLDCLVLNAGMTCRTPLQQMAYADWQAVMDTNVNMPFFLIQRLFAHIAENGSVVFIGSAMGTHPHATSVPYGVSKAAVHALAQNLVKEFAPRGIRVNVIAPGFVDTEWQKEKPKDIRANIEKKTALGRFATPEEVAEVVWMVIQAGYINGAVIAADGGYDFV